MQDYGYACGIGAVRAMVLMPIEHPLDYIKTQIQSKFYMGPAIPFVREHVKQNGFMKLYTGFLPNTFRASIKQAYRLPLMVAFPNLYRRFISKENIIQTLTGISIAVLESYFMCPLERLKIWLMTSPKSTLMSFYYQIDHFKELFKGVNALLVRQTLSWVTFLGLTSLFKETTITYKGKVDYYDLLAIGAIVGVLNTLIIMPADFIKTHQQKFKDVSGKNLFIVLKLLTNSENSLKGKFRIVYCGWKVRMLNYIINAVFTVSLVDYLEHRISTRYIHKHS
ncbi:hypothetical protein SteCoe_2036 [Stentor coeruleus]|uniref:Mitochondrial carrier protein n=1 Tax=Stentor coeruleus TaxID=5963 RepID=A0A1R2D0F4_9CILI|nr:hypothetical protein SteCoe_2036 [Stentor coeruleus]